MKTYVRPVTFSTRRNGRYRKYRNHSLNSWFGWKYLHRCMRLHRRGMRLNGNLY